MPKTTNIRLMAAVPAAVAALALAAAPAQAQTPDFQGGGCAGWFHPVRKVDNILEWGWRTTTPEPAGAPLPPG
jgi:hypothetical protein